MEAPEAGVNLEASRAVALWETRTQTKPHRHLRCRKPVEIAEGFDGDSPSFAIRCFSFGSSRYGFISRIDCGNWTLCSE